MRKLTEDVEKLPLIIGQVKIMNVIRYTLIDNIASSIGKLWIDQTRNYRIYNNIWSGLLENNLQNLKIAQNY